MNWSGFVVDQFSAVALREHILIALTKAKGSVDWNEIIDSSVYGDIRRKLLKVQKPFSALFSDYSIDHAITNPTTCNENETLRSAVELMENHLADPLSLSQLANLVGICERQINRVFRHNLGKPTMSYYRSLRVNKAKNLLKNSRLKISEIAEATGFSNPSHLSGVFSDIYGFPPSKYRVASH